MPTWFERRVLDVIGAITDIYYRKKYGAMARRLGRPAVQGDEKRGFILVQIDGLAHDHLLAAMRRGAMPYTSRLRTAGELSIGPWRCGVPSSTPAVQAGMMFGDRFDIPGFRWYEKDRGTLITPQRVDQIPVMLSRLTRRGPGILHRGSCYVSMFDGDADLALFTLSTLRRQRFFESMRGIGLLLLFFLSPLRALRVLGLATADYLPRLTRRLLALVKPLGQRLRSRLRGLSNQGDEHPRVGHPLDIFSPLAQALSEALFAEVQTFGVMLDIYRRVPAIYTNYNRYDEAAHELGPTHPDALDVLRGIDTRIRQIDRMRDNYKAREYDLYLISDHGNTPARPFRWKDGSTLGKHIIKHIEAEVSLEERIEQHTYASNRARYLREELEALQKSAGPRFGSLLDHLRRHLDRHLREVDPLDYDVRRQRDVVVSASGPLAHIYFNVSRRPLDFVEVLLLYPELLDNLPDTPGIGAVIGRAGERTIVLGARGGTVEIGGPPAATDTPNPLAPYGEVGYAAKQIHRLAHFPHAGDLIVLGEMQEDGTVITFEIQFSAHGGIGGPQSEPFIAWPSRNNLQPESLNDAEDLYEVFMRYQEAAV